MGFWSGAAGVFRVLARSLGDGVPSSPSPSIGQFCSDAEATHAKEQIDRLVDEFVARNAGQAQTNLEASHPVPLGDTPIRQQFAISASGLGWRYVQEGMYGLLVTATGGWQFMGYHVYKHGQRMDQRELSGWRLYRNGDWPSINPYERTNVAEVATASPVVVLQYFRQAIAQWEGGETKRRP